MTASTSDRTESEVQRAAEELLREAELLRALDHPHVVHFLGVCAEEQPAESHRMFPLPVTLTHRSGFFISIFPLH